MALKPASPVIPGDTLPETVWAKDQPQYQPLPSYVHEDGTVISRWRCGWLDRLRILLTGNLWLFVLRPTFAPLQPVSIETEKPLVMRGWKLLGADSYEHERLRMFIGRNQCDGWWWQGPDFISHPGYRSLASVFRAAERARTRWEASAADPERPSGSIWWVMLPCGSEEKARQKLEHAFADPAGLPYGAVVRGSNGDRLDAAYQAAGGEVED
jgi:hypothetical protein